MTYSARSFLWGNSPVDPEIHILETQTIDEAKKKSDQHWKNPRCFHVQVLSPLYPNDPHKLEKRLHLMKSRPTKDRELFRSFEKITVPDGVQSIRGGKDANLLRVCDYQGETLTCHLHLPAKSFYYDICGTGAKEIDAKLCLNGSNALQLEDFETCLAAAAFAPIAIEAFVGESENYWYFLSKVIIHGSRAELSFSMMEAGTEFVQ